LTAIASIRNKYFKNRDMFDISIVGIR